MKVDQKGFSVVEILIVLVIVGFLGAVGWLVYKDHHKDLKSSVSSTQNTTTTSSSSQVVKIPQLGVEITVSGNIGKVDYSMQGIAPALYANLSTDRLSAIDSNCSDTNSGVATLHSVSPSDASPSGTNVTTLFPEGQTINGKYVYIPQQTDGSCIIDPTASANSANLQVSKDTVAAFNTAKISKL
jgi:prepilin-type N-terminal cleavage/methylation domain-containing protein